MIEKYLTQNEWVKLRNDVWYHFDVLHFLSRKGAVRLQLFRDKNICYKFKKLFLEKMLVCKKCGKYQEKKK